jgi:hypothetical protein
MYTSVAHFKSFFIRGASLHHRLSFSAYPEKNFEKITAQLLMPTG